MDDRLRDLEKRLEELVPRGLGERGRERLEETIDSLAAEAGPRSARSRTRWWLPGMGAAAVVAGLVAIAVWPEDQPSSPWPAAGEEVSESEAVPLQTVELVQAVEERFDGGYVLADGYGCAALSRISRVVRASVVSFTILPEGKRTLISTGPSC